MEKMKKQAKRDESRFALLPEPMIQKIQSFLTGKEAALSSCLSKSWYDAWLTRPTPSFDERDFKNGFVFEKISMKVMKRYRDMNLRIESFSLRTDKLGDFAMKLTTEAIRIGATDLNIEVPLGYGSTLVLPAEVLGSETLARLWLRGGKISLGEGNVIRCSRLKSLTLDRVRLQREKDINTIKEIISCCSTSIEELSLDVNRPGHGRINWMHLLQLHNLRRLHLRHVDVEESFFSELATQFPWLKDLSLGECKGYRSIEIASTSIECLSLVGHDKALNAKLDVPNIRKFVYGGSGLPSLSFKACSRHQLECDISIKWTPLYNTSSWFESLTNLLTKLRRASAPSSSSRISLSITPYDWIRDVDLEKRQILGPSDSGMGRDWEKEMIQVVPKHVVVVENLTLIGARPTFASLFLHGLFRVCRPTFILHDHLFNIWPRLKDKMTNLTKVDLNMEFYDNNLQEWRTYSDGGVTQHSKRTSKYRLHCTPTV